MQEHEFILNYARTNPDTSFGADALDWQYILIQSKAHNVAALLYKNIKNLYVAPDILKKFEKIYTYNALHNMVYLEELQRILEETNKEGIGAVVLKGPALAQDIYGNIALRPFIDMDLLVKKEELEKAENILKDMGYLFKDDIFFKRYHFHLPCTRPSKIPVHLELHWEFVDKFILHKIDMDTVRQSVKNNLLPADINIIYLLLHIEKHAFFNKAFYNCGNPREWIFTKPLGNQLIWFTDLYELTQKESIDWENIIKTSKNWCIENILYYNLHILGSLYPVTLPENLPHPELGRIKKFIYKTASKKQSAFSVDPEMQLRPVRAVDLINYLFPSPLMLKNYCKNSHIPVIIKYIIHFLTGSGLVLCIAFKAMHNTRPDPFPRR